MGAVRGIRGGAGGPGARGEITINTNTTIAASTHEAIGQSIDAPFAIFGGASIVLVPEPGVLSGVVLGVGLMMGRKRRGER